MAEQNKNAQEQDLNKLLKVRREKLAELQENGKDPFQIVKYDATHHSQEIKDAFDELEGKSVSVAGRIMSKSVMGKASFCNIVLFGVVWRSSSHFRPQSRAWQLERNTSRNRP